MVEVTFLTVDKRSSETGAGVAHTHTPVTRASYHLVLQVSLRGNRRATAVDGGRFVTAQQVKMVARVD